MIEIKTTTFLFVRFDRFIILDNSLNQLDCLC
jgi:hypothetical protein